MTGAGDGSSALLVLGFESPAFDVEHPMALALECCGDHGGSWERRTSRGEAGSESVGSWREAFLRAPYLRDTFVAMGVLSETFETAITWDRFPTFHESVLEAASAAVARDLRRRLGHLPFHPRLSRRPRALLHDPRARRAAGAELEQWAEIKHAASDAVIAAGGTITHHHAVGRDHRPWYDVQRPEPFAVALAGAKAAVDPAWGAQSRRPDRAVAHVLQCGHGEEDFAARTAQRQRRGHARPGSRRVIRDHA